MDDIKGFLISGDINPERRRRFFKYLLRGAARVRARHDTKYRERFLRKIDHLKDVEDIQDYNLNHLSASRARRNKEIAKEINETGKERDRSGSKERKQETPKNLEGKVVLEDKKTKAEVVRKSVLIKDLKGKIRDIQSKIKIISREYGDDYTSDLKKKIYMLNEKLEEIEGSEDHRKSVKKVKRKVKAKSYGPKKKIKSKNGSGKNKKR